VNYSVFVWLGLIFSKGKETNKKREQKKKVTSSMIIKNNIKMG
jgi:hypothetical protein